MLAGLIKVLKAPSSDLDKNWSWIAFTGAFIFSFFTFGLQYMNGIFYSIWLMEFQASKGYTAWVSTLPLCIMGLFSPLTGVACMKLGEYRTLSFIGSIFMSGSLFISSYADNIDLLFFTYGILMGIGLLLTAPSIILIVTCYFKKYVSVCVAIVTCGSFFAMLILSPLVSYLVEAYQWRFTFRILGAIVSVFCIPASFLFRRHELEESTTDAANLPNPKVTDILKEYLQQISNKKFMVLLISLFIQSFEYIVSYTHFIQYAIDMGQERIVANRMIPIYIALGNIIGRILFGLLFCGVNNKLLLYKFLLILTASIAIIGSFSATFTHLVIFVVAYMVIDGGYKGQAAVVIMLVNGKKRLTQAWTIILCFQSITSIFGPVLVGILSELTSNHKIMFYFMAGPTLISLLVLQLLYFINENHSPKEQNEFEVELPNNNLTESKNLISD